MSAQIIDRLFSSLRLSVDPKVRSEIEAQIAYYSCQVGDFEVARNLLAKVRADPVGRGCERAVIWAIIADGVLMYFERLNLLAIDRFRRASALSTAFGEMELRALSFAWIAHIELAACNYESMVSSINQCLLIGGHRASRAKSRISLVLANCYLLCGDHSNSQAWFESARESALLEGDRTTVGALLYNRGALLLLRYRLAMSLGTAVGSEIRFVGAAVASATNFQARTKNSSLDDLILLSEARLACLEGRSLDALPIFDRLRRTMSFFLSGATTYMLELEYSVALSMSGLIDDARRILLGVNVGSIDSLDLDDKIIFLSELRRICIILDVGPLINDIDVRIKSSIDEYSAEMARLRVAVDMIKL
jgi:hypothetical protein